MRKTKKTLTVERVIHNKMYRLHEEISEIATRATMEAELENMLLGIDNFLQTQQLVIAKKAREGQEYFILGNNEEFVTELDDHVVTVSNILGNRYVEGVKSHAIRIQHQLSQLSKILDEWMDCQRNWLYLEPIFGSPEIKNCLP